MFKVELTNTVKFKVSNLQFTKKSSQIEDFFYAINFLAHNLFQL